MKTRICRNPKCAELSRFGMRFGLCPCCQKPYFEGVSIGTLAGAAIAIALKLLIFYANK